MESMLELVAHATPPIAGAGRQPFLQQPSSQSPVWWMVRKDPSGVTAEKWWPAGALLVLVPLRKWWPMTVCSTYSVHVYAQAHTSLSQFHQTYHDKSVAG